LTGTQRKKILKLYNEGYTIKAISEVINIDYQRVRYFIKKRIEEGTLKSRKEISND
jgi:transposase-like protein